MTAEELKEILETLPPETEICVSAEDNGSNPLCITSYDSESYSVGGKQFDDIPDSERPPILVLWHVSLSPRERVAVETLEQMASLDVGAGEVLDWLDVSRAISGAKSALTEMGMGQQRRSVLQGACDVT